MTTNSYIVVWGGITNVSVWSASESNGSTVMTIIWFIFTVFATVKARNDK